MSLPVVLRAEARREFDEAFDWYEKQRPGRGDAFPIIHRDIPRAVVQRFPYLIYHRVLSSHVVVIAVVHGKRDQGFWRTRT